MSNNEFTTLTDNNRDNENISAIAAIEKKFALSSVNFQKPGRQVLMAGKLNKISRKSTQPRYFIIFDDMLVCADILPGGFLRKPREFKIARIRVEDTEDGPAESPLHQKFYGIQKNAWIIYTTQKSFVVTAETAELKRKWLQKFNEALDQTPPYMSEAMDPVWIPDNFVSKCVHCERDFSQILRKHHCRQCGIVVCDGCSKARRTLQNISATEPVRVCRGCEDTGAMTQSQQYDDHGNNDHEFIATDLKGLYTLDDAF